MQSYIPLNLPLSKGSFHKELQYKPANCVDCYIYSQEMEFRTWTDAHPITEMVTWHRFCQTHQKYKNVAIFLQGSRK